MLIYLHGGLLEAADDNFFHIMTGVIKLIPVMAVSGSTIIAGHGCGISGRAVALAQRKGIFIFLTCAGGTKFIQYVPIEATQRNLAQQVRVHMDSEACKAVSRYMLKIRFGRELHSRHGIAVMRGIEGAAVRRLYSALAERFGIAWTGRVNAGNWSELSPVNRTISTCNSALYNLTEMAVLRAGCSPYIGFIHGRKKKAGKSLVYDIADMVKFETVIPLAFQFAADGKPHPEWRAKAACARLFQKGEWELLEQLTRITEDIIRCGTDYLSANASRRGRKSLSWHLAKN